MPYVITTTAVASPGQVYGPQWVTRRAVATLDEAHEVASNIACGHGMPKGFGGFARDVDERMAQYLPIRYAAGHVPESGGTVGPLPDGTVIDVTPIGLQRMVDELRHAMQPIPEIQTTDRVVASYNAAQEATA